MASDKQIEYIEQLEHFAQQRVENARLTWGDNLRDMPISEARILISDLVNIRDNHWSNERSYSPNADVALQERIRITEKLRKAYEPCAQLDGIINFILEN